MYNVASFVSGRWKTNCYVVSDRANGQNKSALIIDPGKDTSEVLAYIRDLKLQPLAILITHGHYDHTEGIASVAQTLGLKVYMHFDDLRLLGRMNLFRAIYDKEEPIEIPKVDFDLCNQTFVEFGPFKIEVMPTPGHTQGGVCFTIGRQMFTGDTLVDGSVGRIDLPGGSREDLSRSLVKIFNCPGDTLVYPGHGSVFQLKDFPKELCEL